MLLSRFGNSDRFQLVSVFSMYVFKPVWKYWQLQCFSHSAWTNPWRHVETNVWYIRLFNFKMVFVNILLGYKCYWSCTMLPLFLISKKVSCTNWWSPKPNDAISKNYGKKIVISFHKIQLRCQFNFDLLIWSPFDSFRLFFYLELMTILVSTFDMEVLFIVLIFIARSWKDFGPWRMVMSMEIRKIHLL